MDSARSHLKGTLLAVAGVAALSPDALILRLLHTSEANALFWRGLLMAVAIFGFMLLRHRIGAWQRIRETGWHGVVAAVVFAVGTICFVSSIARTEVANTLVIVNASPLFAAGLSYLVLGERQPVRTVLAVVVGLAGVTLIVSGSLGQGSLAGDLFAVGAALCMAVQLVVARHSRDRSLFPALVPGGLLLALVCLPFAAPLQVSARDLLLLVWLGIGVMAVAMTLITIAPRFIPAPEVGLVLLLEAVLGPLLVWLVFLEVPALRTVIGGAVVLVAMAGNQILSARSRARSVASEPTDAGAQ